MFLTIPLNAQTFQLVAPVDEVSPPGWKQVLPAGVPLRIVFVRLPSATPSLELQLMTSVLDTAAKHAGKGAPWRLTPWVAGEAPHTDPTDVLVLADSFALDSPGFMDGGLAGAVRDARVVFLLGAAVRSFAATPWARGVRLALHWRDAQALRPAPHLVTSDAIIEVDGKWTTCCGLGAVLDLGLLFVRDLLGTETGELVQHELCMAQVREPSERQPIAGRQLLDTALPKVAEALALMESNIEEPLATDDIARLVGLSRRQLERLFKKHLGTVPSRRYLELRLGRARTLLREARYSLVEIGLMCGFSSGSHFSSSYSAMFGVTPREERARILRQALETSQRSV